MGGKYKSYPKYKASGIEWLGDVPEGWDVGRLKNVLKIRNGRDYKDIEVDNKEDGYPVYGSGGIFKFSSDYLYDGVSILFGRKGTIDKPLIVNGKFWTVDTMFYSELYPNINSLYIYNQSLLFPYDLLSTSTALPSITQEDLLELTIVIPPLSEQQQIVDFLDREVGKIEALIAKQERLVELLTEKRQAVISHAVTKGLNPNTPMKPSAIEWLGDIPEHWDVKPLKYVISYNDETLSEDTKGDFSFEYIDIGSVSSGKINKTDSIIFENAPSRARRVVRSGDIIISTVRTYLEAIAVIPDSDIVQIVSTGFCVIRSRLLLGVYSKYLFFTRFFITEVIARSVGVSYPAINASDLVNIYIPFPPSSEQQQIVDFLDQETKKIDSLIQKSQHMVILLKERKTALISAAVTGKIDVRN